MTAASIRVVLVDDHPLVRTGVRGMLAGEPDRMIAAGVCFFSHASADWNGTISQYVPCSRKRRAISCVT